MILHVPVEIAFSIRSLESISLYVLYDNVHTTVCNEKITLTNAIKGMKNNAHMSQTLSCISLVDYYSHSLDIFC
jgi:hypothetical protein